MERGRSVPPSVAMLNLRGVNNRHEPDLRAMVGFAMFNISFTLMLFPQYISDAYLYGYEVMGGMMACWGLAHLSAYGYFDLSVACEACPVRAARCSCCMPY